MRFRKPEQRRIAKVATIALVIVAGIILVCSLIGKYLVEKYDLSYLGREVTVDWVYLNPFTGFVQLNGPEVKELKNDTIFFSANSVSADFAVLKMFLNTFEITTLSIDKPVAVIIQKKEYLNFGDIIEKLRPTGSGSGPVHFSILRITIAEGEFHYREKIIPIDYFVKNVNLESSGILWDSDTIASTFSFNAGKGTGIVSGNFAMNRSTLDYRLATVINDLDLELIRQYLWELINYGMFRARFNADLTATGNFHDVNLISLKGKLSLNDFHLGKTTTEDYVSCGRLSLVMNELSPNNNKYLFDSVTVDDAFISYERFDSLDNVQALFGKSGANISDVTKEPGRFNLLIEIGRYIKKLGQKFFESKYRINVLAFNNGNFRFTDFSLSEKFQVDMPAIYFHGDSITKTNKRVRFYLKSGIYPHGNLSASLSINPLDSGDLDLDYRVHNLPVTAFNPYIITYTSFPLDKGVLELNGAWKVRGGVIKSTNEIIVIDPGVGARLKEDGTKWTPLPLIMSLVRERGNVINYRIPVTGNLKNPKFHLQDVVTDLLVNVFIKPLTINYGLQVKKAEREIEELLTITWKVHQFELEPEQRKFVASIAHFLKKHSDSSIDIYPELYASKEKEHILFFEARKKYYLLENKKSEKDFNRRDSLKVELLSVKDLGRYFTKDMTKITRDTTMLTSVDKCYHFLASNIVDSKYDQLLKSRETELRSFFVENATSSRVKFHQTKTSIPFNGFSWHKIEYNGALPESLLTNYKNLQTLNDRTFRKKYFDLDVSKSAQRDGHSYKQLSH
jgi:hypothetical protein